MGIQVSLRQSPGISQIALKQIPQTIVRTIGIGYSSNSSTQLRNLSDVDSTDMDNNETVVYNIATDKFEVKPLVIIDGGEF